MNQSSRLLWPATGVGLLAGLVFGVLGTLVVSSSDGPDAAEESGGPPEQGGPPPASVNVGPVVIQTLQHRVPVIGRLQELRRVTVTAETEGKITRMPVEEGDLVTGGETMLAQIDDVWANLRLDAARAQVAVAEADLKQSQTDLEQLEQLRAAGSARAKEVDDARTLVAGNLARLNAAAAERDRASLETQRAAIMAPFDGAVSRKIAEVGQWLSPGDPVIEMVSTGQIDAVIDVPERYVQRFSLGDPVEVVIEVVDERIVGRVISVRPDASEASRTFPVKIRLDDPDIRLRPGMSVVAHLPITREAEFVTVPRDAVLYSPGGAAVWYAAEVGQPLPAAFAEPVKVLFGVGDRYAVEPLPGAPRPALTAGTLVVTEGAERLFPSRPLQLPAEPDAEPTADNPARPADVSDTTPEPDA